MEILMDRVEFVPGQALPLFELKPPVFEGIDFAIKRTFDIVGSVLLVVFLAPVMGLAALAIKLTSRGPVLYRSIRPGIGGKPFACLKFRTMVHGAEHLQDDLEAHNELSGALFNVVRGEMSLVGPRPLPQRDYDRLEDWHRKRYLVLPGMTGLWQVSGRSELDFDELVKLDFLLDRQSEAATLQVHYDQEHARERALLERRLGRADGDVLSVGCGWHPGRHLFPRPAWRMTGTDLNPAMVEHLLESGELDAGAEGRAGELPFEPGSFDVVLYRLPVHHNSCPGAPGAF